MNRINLPARAGWIPLVCGCALLHGGCAAHDDSPAADGASFGSVGQSLVQTGCDASGLCTVKVDIPSCDGCERAPLIAGRKLVLGDRARTFVSANVPAPVLNTGVGQTTLGTDTKVGHLLSQPSVWLRERAHVFGDLWTEGAISMQNSVRVDGTTRQGTRIPINHVSWSVTWPTDVKPQVHLEPDQERWLAPGAYAGAHVKSRSRLHLWAGTYYLDSLMLEPNSVLEYDASYGPVIVYVKDGVTQRGFTRSAMPTEGLVIVDLGSNPVELERSLDGLLVAPNATVRFATSKENYFGVYIGRELEVHQQNTVQRSLPPNLWNTELAPLAIALGQTGPTREVCSIVLGEGGNSRDFSVELPPGGTAPLPDIGEWSFVRQTRGQCHFQLFNSTNYGGDHVTIGNALTDRIRIGIDGFVNREDGGGSTWRARSLIVTRPDTNTPEMCTIGVGSNGASMTLYASVDDVPKVAYVRHTSGRNCRAMLNDGTPTGIDRYKFAFPGIDSDFDVGYHMRSIYLSSWRQDICPVRASVGTANYGRCLPWAEYPELSGEDSDYDGVDDAVESWVALNFVPYTIYDSDQAPVSNPENGKLLYQVFANDPNLDEFELTGSILWSEDRGYGPSSTCVDDHPDGDVAGLGVLIRRAVPGANYYVPFVVDSWHHAHWEDGKRWDHEWSEDYGGGNRGFDFAGTHARLYLSAHKHHPYNDTGWNHQDSAYSDYGCNDDVDGNGMQKLPDLFPVGNRDHRRINWMSDVDPDFSDQAWANDCDPLMGACDVVPYDFWTSRWSFCGKGIARQSGYCSGTVLSTKPFTRGACRPGESC